MNPVEIKVNPVEIKVIPVETHLNPVELDGNLVDAWGASTGFLLTPKRPRWDFAPIYYGRDMWEMSLVDCSSSFAPGQTECVEALE